MVWGIPTDIETLNPILSAGASETDILNGLFSTLFKIDHNMHLQPDLLLEMPMVSADALQYSFLLRDDVTFHDGTPLTADDVRFTYEMKMAEGTIVPSRAMWEKIDTFDVTGPFSFTITLHEADVTWLESWAYADAMIIPKHIVEQEFLESGGVLTKGGRFSRNPVGSGPFEFVEWRPNEYILLKAYPGYFRGEPAIRQILFKLIPDTNSMLAQLVSGEIDVYDRAQPSHYKELVAMQEAGKEIEVFNYPSFTYLHADFNLRRPVFQDKAVRQALMYAFPRSDYIDTVLDGVATPAHSYIPPMSWAYHPDVKQYDYDPQKASDLLNAAGWLPGEDGVRQKDGVRLSFAFTTVSGKQERESLQQIAKQEWENLGAEVKIKNYEGGTFGAKLMGLEFDLILFAWISGSDPDGEDLWHSRRQPDVFGAGMNIVGYSNARVDELLEAGTKVSDRERRREIYHAVQEILADDLPSMFICYLNNVTAVPANLKNFKPNPTVANNTWNIYEWELE